MAKNPDPSLMLTSSAGTTRTLDDWSTMFQLCLVVLPGRVEATAYLPVAQRIFATFGDSDCTCAFLVTAEAEVARRMLGDLEQQWLTFVDPAGELVDSFGLERLPAFVFLRQDTTVAVAAEGWNPPEWQAAVRQMATAMAWTVPEVAGAGDPPRGTDWPAKVA